MSPRAARIYAAALLSFFALLGAHALWEGIYNLPADYSTLAQTGVPVSLKVTHCASGVGGGKGFGCDVRLDHAGETRVWAYPYETNQFYPYTPGETIAALEDPGHPSTVYTVRNVQDRWGAGWTSRITLFGLGCEILAATLATVFWAVGRRIRRLRVGAPASA